MRPGPAGCRYPPGGDQTGTSSAPAGGPDGGQPVPCGLDVLAPLAVAALAAAEPEPDPTGSGGIAHPFGADAFAAGRAGGAPANQPPVERHRLNGYSPLGTLQPARRRRVQRLSPRANSASFSRKIVEMSSSPCPDSTSCR
jgi:hypothetical protein